MRDTTYVPNARRFDMGERDHFETLEMAAIGMEMMAGLGRGSSHRAAQDADRTPRRGGVLLKSFVRRIFSVFLFRPRCHPA